MFQNYPLYEAVQSCCKGKILHQSIIVFCVFSDWDVLSCYFYLKRKGNFLVISWSPLEVPLAKRTWRYLEMFLMD